MAHVRHQAGPEHAQLGRGTLIVSSNDPNSPADVVLSGTGGALPQGPTGATGRTGATGHPGKPGPRAPRVPCGPAGPVRPAATVVCHVADQPYGDLAMCVVTYSKRTHAPIRATLRRGHHMYASTISHAGKRVVLVLRTRHPLAHGRYTLTLNIADRRA